MHGNANLLRVVTYHELSHFYLREPHTTHGELDIMMPVLSPEQADSIVARWEFYKRRLFVPFLIRSYFLPPDSLQ